MLTTTRGDRSTRSSPTTISSKHVGHRMEVKGKAADRGDGKVKIESTIGTSGSDKSEGQDRAQGRHAPA